MTDSELLKTATEVREEVLHGTESKGQCLQVVTALQAKLKTLGLYLEARTGEVDNRRIGNIEINSGVWSHYWLELVDGRILDPTSDQFNSSSTEVIMPNVYIGGKPNWYNQKA